MSTLVLISGAFLVAAAVTIRAWRGDGRTDLRRCPRCWYDMSATGSMRCSECGHTAQRESDLNQRRSSRRVYRTGVVVMGLLAIVGVYTAIPGPWTSKFPRPLIRLLLSIAAAPPGPPMLNAGWLLPVPDTTLLNSASAWDRAVWQHQASIAVEGWATSVLATEGPITDEELAKLVPMVDQVRGLWQAAGALPWREAWIIESARQRLASARIAAANDSNRLLRIEWALAELQFTGGGYSHRPDFARVPDAIIHQALVHPDSNVREFGITAVGRRVVEVVMDPTSPIPSARESVEAMATGDDHPRLRKAAAALVSYMDEMLPKK
ncbi:MAG: hypothetical protein ACOYN0_16085 [Phycisphaerales bacterium]